MNTNDTRENRGAQTPEEYYFAQSPKVNPGPPSRANTDSAIGLPAGLQDERDVADLYKVDLPFQSPSPSAERVNKHRLSEEQWKQAINTLVPFVQTRLQTIEPEMVNDFVTRLIAGWQDRVSMGLPTDTDDNLENLLRTSIPIGPISEMFEHHRYRLLSIARNCVKTAEALVVNDELPRLGRATQIDTQIHEPQPKIATLDAIINEDHHINDLQSAMEGSNFPENLDELREDLIVEIAMVVQVWLEGATTEDYAERVTKVTSISNDVLPHLTTIISRLNNDGYDLPATITADQINAWLHGETAPVVEQRGGVLEAILNEDIQIKDGIARIQNEQRLDNQDPASLEDFRQELLVDLAILIQTWLNGATLENYVKMSSPPPNLTDAVLAYLTTAISRLNTEGHLGLPTDVTVEQLNRWMAVEQNQQHLPETEFTQEQIHADQDVLARVHARLLAKSFFKFKFIEAIDITDAVNHIERIFSKSSSGIKDSSVALTEGDAEQYWQCFFAWKHLSDNPQEYYFYLQKHHQPFLTHVMSHAEELLGNYRPHLFSKAKELSGIADRVQSEAIQPEAIEIAEKIDFRVLDLLPSSKKETDYIGEKMTANPCASLVADYLGAEEDNREIQGKLLLKYFATMSETMIRHRRNGDTAIQVSIERDGLSREAYDAFVELAEDINTTALSGQPFDESWIKDFEKHVKKTETGFSPETRNADLSTLAALVANNPELLTRCNRDEAIAFTSGSGFLQRLDAFSFVRPLTSDEIEFFCGSLMAFRTLHGDPQHGELAESILTALQRRQFLFDEVSGQASRRSGVVISAPAIVAEVDVEPQLSPFKRLRRDLGLLLVGKMGPREFWREHKVATLGTVGAAIGAGALLASTIFGGVGDGREAKSVTPTPSTVPGNAPTSPLETPTATETPEATATVKESIARPQLTVEMIVDVINDFPPLKQYSIKVEETSLEYDQDGNLLVHTIGNSKDGRSPITFTFDPLRQQELSDYYRVLEHNRRFVAEATGTATAEKATSVTPTATETPEAVPTLSATAALTPTEQVVVNNAVANATVAVTPTPEATPQTRAEAETTALISPDELAEFLNKFTKYKDVSDVWFTTRNDTGDTLIAYFHATVDGQEAKLIMLPLTADFQKLIEEKLASSASQAFADEKLTITATPTARATQGVVNAPPLVISAPQLGPSANRAATPESEIAVDKSGAMWNYLVAFVDTLSDAKDILTGNLNGIADALKDAIMAVYLGNGEHPPANWEERMPSEDKIKQVAQIIDTVLTKWRSGSPTPERYQELGKFEQLIVDLNNSRAMDGKNRNDLSQEEISWLKKAFDAEGFGTIDQLIGHLNQLAAETNPTTSEHATIVATGQRYATPAGDNSPEAQATAGAPVPFGVEPDPNFVQPAQPSAEDIPGVRESSVVVKPTLDLSQPIKVIQVESGVQNPTTATSSSVATTTLEASSPVTTSVTTGVTNTLTAEAQKAVEIDQGTEDRDLTQLAQSLVEALVESGGDVQALLDVLQPAKPATDTISAGSSNAVTKTITVEAGESTEVGNAEVISTSEVSGENFVNKWKKLVDSTPGVDRGLATNVLTLVGSRENFLDQMLKGAIEKVQNGNASPLRKLMAKIFQGSPTSAEINAFNSVMAFSAEHAQELQITGDSIDVDGVFGALGRVLASLSPENARDYFNFASPSAKVDMFRAFVHGWHGIKTPEWMASETSTSTIHRALSAEALRVIADAPDGATLAVTNQLVTLLDGSGQVINSFFAPK